VWSALLRPSDVPYALLNGRTKLAHRFDYDIRPRANILHIESLRDSKFEIIIQKADIIGNSIDIVAEVTARITSPA
jgi:hypothetical protein